MHDTSKSIFVFTVNSLLLRHAFNIRQTDALLCIYMLKASAAKFCCFLSLSSREVNDRGELWSACLLPNSAVNHSRIPTPITPAS